MWHVRWRNDAKTFLECILPFVRLKAAEVRFALDWIAVDERFARTTTGNKGRMTPTHKKWREQMAVRLSLYREDRTKPLDVSEPTEGLKTPLLNS